MKNKEHVPHCAQWLFALPSINYPNIMHIKFLLPTALIKQPTRSQELPNDICLPIQGKVKKFKKNAGPLGNLWPKFTNSE